MIYKCLNLSLLLFILAFVWVRPTHAQNANKKAETISEIQPKSIHYVSHSFINASIYSSFTSLVGHDDNWPNINITSPLTLGIKLGYIYTEGSLSLLADLGYRNINFKNDTKNNISIHNEAAVNDFSLSYAVSYKAWNPLRFTGRFKYLNLYYFQSMPSQSFVEVHSVLGGQATLGAEWDAWNTNDFIVTVLGSLGTSLPTSNLEQGQITLFSLKFNYLYSKEYVLFSDLSYSESYNSTSSNQFTRFSKQGRADLGLSFGIQSRF